MDGGVSTDSKSSNRIAISLFVQVLLKFYLFLGLSPLGMGGDGNWCRHPPHSFAHTHACTHMCAQTYMHVKHDKHGCLQCGGNLQFPNMFILVFNVCACMHVHVHMFRDTPDDPRGPPLICPIYPHIPHLLELKKPRS